MTEGWLIKQMHVYNGEFTSNPKIQIGKHTFKKNNRNEYNLHFKLM